MPIVNEGETGGATNNKNLIYPNLNSCLSITIRAADGSVFGGHAVLWCNSNQLKIDKIIDEIKLYGGKPSHVYFIGDTETWEQNLASISTYSSLAAVAKQLGCENTHTIIDVDRWTGGSGMVQVGFQPATRSYWIASNDAKTIHQKGGW